MTLAKKNEGSASLAVISCVGLAAAVALSGCVHGLNTGGQATKFDLVVSSSADSTKNHPPNAPFKVSASCQPGQQLVGGGYNLLNNISGNPTNVAIEGNFPSDTNTWTVQARNPDNTQIYNADADVVVQVLAYCVTSPNYDLSTEVVQQQGTITHDSANFDVRCSQTTALALSGGFLTSTLPVYVEPGGAVHQAFWPGLQGSGVIASGPSFPDKTHSAMGWNVTQQYSPAIAPTAPQPPVTTTVFALCARKNINAQAYRIATTKAVLAATAPVTALCQTGEFTVGGGYDGTPLASETSGSLAVHTPFSFDGWQMAGDSTGVAMDTNALCVRIPFF